MKKLVFKPQNKEEAKIIVDFWNPIFSEQPDFNGSADIYTIEYDTVYCPYSYQAWYNEDCPAFNEAETSEFIAIPAFLKFPKEIQKEMIRRSEYQSPIPFIFNISSDKRAGGFDWAETDEGWDFWNKVIDGRDFDLFYKRFNLKKDEVRLCNEETPLGGDSKQVKGGIRCRDHQVRVTVKPLSYKGITGRG